jgi:hypothetical protein
MVNDKSINRKQVSLFDVNWYQSANIPNWQRVDNQLNVTVVYDNDPTAGSMFLPKAQVFDGNVTREGNYNS